MRSGWGSVAVACLWLALGEAVRLWAVGYAGARTRTRSPSGRLKELVTSGPYAYVRNPIYLGNCLIAVGILLLFERWVVAPPILLAVFLGYHLVVLWEEQLLAATFGEAYTPYRRDVPRWIPHLRGYAFPSHHRFCWSQALTSERGTLLTLVLLLLAFGIRAWVEPLLR
jgi:protein-S-isoprenylcysteine O-methyltransferase Ste14